MTKIAVAINMWNEEQLLPLCIRGLYDLPIDMVAIYDGHSSDNSVVIAMDMLANLKCPFYIRYNGRPHDKYFELHDQENEQFNQWHKDLKDYDWILHLDVDEIYSPQLGNLLSYIKENDVPFNGVYFQRYHVVGNPGRAVWRLYENDNATPQFDESVFHVTRGDWQLRLYKRSDYFYPHLTTDTFPHAIRNHKCIRVNEVKIIHIKLMRPGRRHDRGSTNNICNNHSWEDERNEFITIPREFIPDRLIEFNRNLKEYTW